MMTRFDGTLIEWWNPAQAKLLASDEYKEICKDVLEEHGKMSNRVVLISQNVNLWICAFNLWDVFVI